MAEPPLPDLDETDLALALAQARAEIERLTAENADLQMLYEATIEHGEAVEDQLAENNILLKRTQERLNAELQDAARYVQSILPVPRKADPQTEWLLVPSTELGGDSFGYHEIDEDHFAIYLLDVCGHGVGAALLSVTVINVLRAAALAQSDTRDPSNVLAALNAAFPMERQADMFFTIWYGVYRRSTGRLAYAAGGHPPAILLREEGGAPVARLLKGGGGMAVGVVPGMDYAAEEIDIAPGDRLLVLSDGTYEVAQSASRMLTFDDLLGFVQTPGGDRPEAVLDWIHSVHGPGALPDDFTLLRVTF
jgi:phosphoserine phosphatase RsbU/P